MGLSRFADAINAQEFGSYVGSAGTADFELEDVATDEDEASGKGRRMTIDLSSPAVDDLDFLQQRGRSAKDWIEESLFVRASLQKYLVEGCTVWIRRKDGRAVQLLLRK